MGRASVNSRGDGEYLRVFLLSGAAVWRGCAPKHFSFLFCLVTPRTDILEHGQGYGPATLQAEVASRLLPASATTVSSKLESSTAMQDAGIVVPVKVVVDVVTEVVCGPEEEERE